MPARLDPFVDVMLRERADQLYLLPDEPVTLVKDGKPRKVSKQPLTDQHIYAMMVEVAAPMVDRPMSTPGELPGEFASSEYQGAEQKLGKLLRGLVESSSSDLHLRVGEPPLFRTHGEIKRQSGSGLSVNDLELLVLSIMPERNRGEWKETGDTDFAYEISGLARFRVNAARDRKGPVAVFRVIPAKVVTVEEMG